MSNRSAAELENKKPLARCRNQLLVLSLALLMVAQSIGCSSVSSLGFGEAITVAYRDLVWARRAFNLRFGNCDRPYAEHFQSGFCAGYIDTSNGGDGFVPALPPAEYRGVEYQSVDGAQCVNTWFEGYPAGVAAAKQDKAGNFHDVMISKLVNAAIQQEKTENLLPQDIPIVNAHNEPSETAVAKEAAPEAAPPIVSPPIAPSLPKDLAPTGLPPIISSNALSISPVKKSLEPIKTALPKIVPAPKIVPVSYGAKSNTPLPAAISNKPWTSSRK